MKRIHYLLLGLLVSLTIAATGPGLPPTRIAPGTNTTVVTNGVNSFTISSSAGGSGAQLDGTNVFTGTNTFAPESFYPPNNIGMRLLWSSPTNIYLNSLAVSAAPTNNGDYSLTTSIAAVNLPALLGSNSAISVHFSLLRTNANSTQGSIYFYGGTATNFIGSQAVFNTAVGVFNTVGSLVQSCNSFTNQCQAAFVNPSIPMATNFLGDTASSFPLFIGAATTSSFTNGLIYGLRIYEFYAP